MNLFQKQRQFLNDLRTLKYYLYYKTDYSFVVDVPISSIYDREYKPVINDFEIICNREWKDNEIKYTKWKNYLEFDRLISNRELLPNEIVLENDIIGRSNAIKMTKEIKNWLDNDKFYFVYWIKDHYGRSPHTHILFISKFQRTKFLKEFYEFLCKKHNIPFILIPYYDMKHLFTFDKSLIDFNPGKHLIRCCFGAYQKNDKISYCSVVEDLNEIKPIINTEDIKFPEIQINKIINYLKNKK